MPIDELLQPISTNLFPYRAANRQQGNQKMLAGIALYAAVVGMAYYGVYDIFASRVENEKAQIAYLQGVQGQLDQQIASVKSLRQKKKELLAREEIIARLQTERNLPVEILNALAKITPDGIFLTSVKETQSNIAISGYAQGNDQVAEFLRQIGAQTKLFHKPTLDIISKTQVGGQTAYGFTLQMQLRLPKVPEPVQPGPHPVAPTPSKTAPEVSAK